MNSKYGRAICLIYFCFIDNESKQKRSIIKRSRHSGLLERVVDDLGIDYRQNDSIVEHATIMSVDLLIRYFLKERLPDEQYKPWVLPINYLSLATETSRKASKIQLGQINADVDALGFIHDCYIRRYENYDHENENNDNKLGCKKENPYKGFSAILSSQKCKSRLYLPNDPELLIDIKLFLELLSDEIERSSISLQNIEDHRDAIFYRLMAINLIEMTASYQKEAPDEAALSLKKDDLNNLFSHLVAGSILTSDILISLQALIDALLFPPLFKEPTSLCSRKKYIDWVVKKTKERCSAIKAMNFNKRIETLSSKHGVSFSRYIADRACSKHKEKFWFIRMKEDSINNDLHYFFVLTALSLLPVDTSFRVILNRATSAISSNNYRSYADKNTVKLNIDIDKELRGLIEKICQRESILVREFMTDLILNELEDNYPNEYKTMFTPSKLKGPSSSASSLLMDKRYKKSNKKSSEGTDEADALMDDFS